MAWKPIIVGVDGTPESLRAAEVAQMIASAARAQLIPVHAVPAVPALPGVGGIEPVPVFSPDVQRELSRSSRAQIVGALEKVLPQAAVQRLELQTGPAPFVVADVARMRGAGLVVLGGKQHGALARGLGRSTAHFLVRSLDMPVLVVGQSSGPITRVLAAVDLSAASAPTAEAAERFAHIFGAPLRLLHAVEPLGFPYVPPDVRDEEQYEKGSREAFERFVAPFKEVIAENRVVRRGLPAEVIAEEASAWHADVVVVGSHGKGWVHRILLGSTTERLVTELPTSVLVVHAKPGRAVRFEDDVSTGSEPPGEGVPSRKGCCGGRAVAGIGELRRRSEPSRTTAPHVA